MTITAGGRSALVLAILATGLFVGFAGPSPAGAATDDNAVADAKSASTEADAAEKVTVRKYTRHGSRHWKRHAQHKSEKVALKSSSRKKADAPDTAADSADVSTAISPSVANANAQLAAADTPDNPLTGNARAMSARANDIVQGGPEQPTDAQPAPQVQTVAPVLQAAAADKPADAEAPADTAAAAPDQLNEADRSLQVQDVPSTKTVAMASTSRPASETGQAANNDSSTLDKTSLIGKIFIAFGALLTVASAARMFMA